jgi:hypothetical protein
MARQTTYPSRKSFLQLGRPWSFFDNKIPGQPEYLPQDGDDAIEERAAGCRSVGKIQIAPPSRAAQLARSLVRGEEVA